MIFNASSLRSNWTSSAGYGKERAKYHFLYWIDDFTHSAHFEVMKALSIFATAVQMIDIGLIKDVTTYGQLFNFKEIIPTIRLAAPKQKDHRCGLHAAHNMMILDSVEKLLEPLVKRGTENVTVSRVSKTFSRKIIKIKLSR